MEEETETVTLYWATALKIPFRKKGEDEKRLPEVIIPPVIIPTRGNENDVAQAFILDNAEILKGAKSTGKVKVQIVPF